MEIKHKITNEVLKVTEGDTLKGANLSEANLNEANLRGANLSEANLRGANLSEADLIGANLSEANLSEANLSDADLSIANLNETNLREANLTGANLNEANLTEADLDYSCWPLWCGSLEVKLDMRLKRQLLYHILAVAPEFRTKKLIKEANKFHRVTSGECPKLKIEKRVLE
jgi:uncharacterized protein YjbI with pentapeptide repeats